ncbi:unnamed protein product, partial [Prunus brigantina]
SLYIEDEDNLPFFFRWSGQASILDLKVSIIVSGGNMRPYHFWVSIIKRKEFRSPLDEGGSFELGGKAVELVILDDHVVKVLVVGDENEGIEIFAVDLVLEKRK